MPRIRRLAPPLLLRSALLALIVAAFVPAAEGQVNAAKAGPAFEALGWRPAGLVRVRDLTPFGILRLDLLPAHAVAANPGTFAIEANLSYQNTYVLSDNVAEYLEARGPGRAALSPEDVDAILAFDDDAYFVDGEFGLVDLTLHYRASEHWGLYATIPYYTFDGGFLDQTIEDFHENFGFSPASRDRVLRDDFQVVSDVNGVRFVIPQAPENAFGDPVVAARWSMFVRPERWNLIVEGAAKLALRGQERFTTTGNHDYGLQLTWQRFFRGAAFYASAAAVYYDGPIELPESETIVPTVILGYEQRVSPRSSLIAQFYASPSVIQDSTAEELTEDKYQVTLGFQTWRGRTLYRLGLTENVSNFNNTPDIGVTLQVGYVLQGRGTP